MHATLQWTAHYTDRRTDRHRERHLDSLAGSRSAQSNRHWLLAKHLKRTLTVNVYQMLRQVPGGPFRKFWAQIEPDLLNLPDWLIDWSLFVQVSNVHVGTVPIANETRGMCTLWRCRSTPSLPGITFRVTCSVWGSDMKYIYNGRTDSRIFLLKCSWCSSRHAT